MNPMTVKIFDGVKHRFLDMCITSRKDVSTGPLEKWIRPSIPCCNCVCLSVDNTSVNLGTRNLLQSRIHQKHTSVYVLGCTCHIL